MLWFDYHVAAITFLASPEPNMFGGNKFSVWGCI